MTSPPKDRYWLAWFIFCLLGMGCLLPWSFFISVSDYWMYKFRNVSDTNYGSDNLTDVVLTPLQMKWNSYLSIASMIPRGANKYDVQGGGVGVPQQQKK